MKSKRGENEDRLAAELGRRVVGQREAIQGIIPYVEMYQAGLSPEGRPAGVFLLLGPTGTGKTRTVEALADVLHGTEKALLRIDCGEFQMEHEVAKLIGAPPGYLGHRETQPVLTQMKLTAVASERSSLSLVLFDEIEKAAPSMTRLLLGVLDRATLRLGDNTSVNFERALIFLTSNVGAQSMMRELGPGFGFEAPVGAGVKSRRVEAAGLSAARKAFAPEFLNRIDAILTYRPLSQETLAAILEQQLAALQRHIDNRLGPNGFRVEVSREARRFLLERGTSPAHGARELKRTVHRHVIHPLASLVSAGKIEPGATVRFDRQDGERLRAA